MIVVETVNSRAQLREFIDLPSRLYADCPDFRSPLRLEQAMMLDDRHSSFWQNPENRCRYWLARRDGQAVGRISAQISAHQPVGVAPGSGAFGCLDTIDDGAVVDALLQAARVWLQEQGCTAMFGPCTLDMNMEPGLLVEGADEAPMLLSGWHPPYLGARLEQTRLARIHDLHFWRIDLGEGASLPSMPASLAFAQLSGMTIRYPDRHSYTRDIATMCEIYNDGWRGNWGFVPLTPANLKGFDLLMKWKVPRRAFKIVELHGRPAAVMLLVPNLRELSDDLGARPGVTGWVKLIWRALTHRFASGRFIVTGMTRQLQGTATGALVIAKLIEETIADCAAFGGKWAEAGWVLESNRQMIRILERFGFRRNKTYRLYGETFDAAPSAEL